MVREEGGDKERGDGRREEEGWGRGRMVIEKNVSFMVEGSEEANDERGERKRPERERGEKMMAVKLESSRIASIVPWMNTRGQRHCNRITVNTGECYVSYVFYSF